MFKGCLLLLALVGYGQLTWACGDQLKHDQMSAIGRQIFKNECGGLHKCLVHWNETEAFPSLGIGHFIWYPKGIDAGYVESFPLLVSYLKKGGVDLPAWLAEIKPFDAPWQSRDQYINSADQGVAKLLREFLGSHMAEQTMFMNHRMQKSLTQVTKGIELPVRKQVDMAIENLCQTPAGVYALIDYVNFKGEGVARGESYNGQGWGLKQVLLDLVHHNQVPMATTVRAFAESAKRVLIARANRAPNPKEVDVWLPVWLKRIDTYTSY